jgi:hypothetical protein
MKTKGYTIDELIQIFQTHSEKYWKEELERKERFLDSADYSNGFCICDALLSMCKKMKKMEGIDGVD